VRGRLDFAGGGHRRAAVWRTAQLVAARHPELINDPTTTTWDAIVDEDAGRLELRPRRFVDTRFAWRVRDVPAASHPTLAAAIARVGGARDGDVVWDPFVGSGAELIERAHLGGFARLIGSDLDARALDATRANLEAAGLLSRAELHHGDALAFAPPGVTQILSNPPLGRRLRGDAPALLERFVAHAARVLVRGGRLTWVTPVPARTAKAARAAGLHGGDGVTVDLGGFDGRLETWTRP
jgi:predicted RNA methylase